MPKDDKEESGQTFFWRLGCPQCAQCPVVDACVAKAEGQPQVPLLLVRSGDLRAAVAVDQVLGTLAGGVQSGLGYLGARNLTEHRANARYIRVTPAGQREAAPHDVIEIKAGS